MKLSAGYRLPDGRDSFVEIAADYREALAEVYFAPPGEASGRSPLGAAEGWSQEEAGETLAEELREISSMKLGCVVLFNAACYGEEALSPKLAERVAARVEGLLKKGVGLTAATTCSPFLARSLKREFPFLELRASVNMRVGSLEALEHLSGTFDGFYMQRDFNRDLKRIKALKGFCERHGKKLYLLANSGCLKNCPFQSFHDNLVAHELKGPGDADARFPAPCWERLSEESVQWQALRSCWVRPEELQRYEGLFDGAKLATRAHENPRKVVAAYARGSFKGNLLELMEPSFAPLFGARELRNEALPADWFERSSNCDGDCERCGYCRDAFAKALREDGLAAT